MRRSIAAVVASLAVAAALLLTASSADAKSYRTKAFLDDISASSGTWVFSGNVESKKAKCIGRRKVGIYVAPVRIGARGASFDDPVATGRTKRDGTFALDNGGDLLLVAPYEARVQKRKPKPGVRCRAAISDPLSPPVRTATIRR